MFDFALEMFITVIENKRKLTYGNFSLKEVRKRFELSEERKILFSVIIEQNPSNWLIQTLKFNEDAALISEKERSELLFSPILTERRQRNNKIFSVYSGAHLDADISFGLNGDCDFILTKSPQLISVETPIFCLVEAKKDDIINTFGQCVAQMLGVRIYNQKDGNTIETIYGCVTTGIE